MQRPQEINHGLHGFALNSRYALHQDSQHATDGYTEEVVNQSLHGSMEFNAPLVSFVDPIEVVSQCLHLSKEEDAQMTSPIHRIEEPIEDHGCKQGHPYSNLHILASTSSSLTTPSKGKTVDVDVGEGPLIALKNAFKAVQTLLSTLDDELHRVAAARGHNGFLRLQVKSYMYQDHHIRCRRPWSLKEDWFSTLFHHRAVERIESCVLSASESPLLPINDALEFHHVTKVNPLCFKHPSVIAWSEEESQTLSEAVRAMAVKQHQIAQMYQYGPAAMAQQLQLLQRMERDQVEAQAKVFTAEDWKEIAGAFGGVRTCEEARLYWFNHAAPGINTMQWNTKEGAKLVQTVEDHGGYNWALMAAELENGRSPFQCLQE